LTVSSLKEQVKLHTPDMVLLLETKTRSHRYGFLKKILGMNFMHAVEARGLILVSDDEKRYVWHFFGVYASTDDKQRKAQWLTLRARISRCPEACLVMGDFNDILYNSEKQGGNFRMERSMHDFWSFVADSQLLDLGFVGYPFTWLNRRQEGGIQERLDRGLRSALWLHHYPEATVSNQVVEGSDHSMLILRTHAVKKRRKSIFIYDPRWGAHEGCKVVVAQQWAKVVRGPQCAQMHGKLIWVQKGLLDWKRREWRNSHVRIDALWTDLRAEYQKTEFDSSTVKEMEFNLQSALQEEEIYWKLKSRVQWLKKGEKNTKFFHTKTIARK
ncbi:unnamed protein product, partial [Prunus brigantina]